MTGAPAPSPVATLLRTSTTIAGAVLSAYRFAGANFLTALWKSSIVMFLAAGLTLFVFSERISIFKSVPIRIAFLAAFAWLAVIWHRQIQLNEDRLAPTPWAFGAYFLTLLLIEAPYLLLTLAGPRILGDYRPDWWLMSAIELILFCAVGLTLPALASGSWSSFWRALGTSFRIAPGLALALPFLIAPPLALLALAVSGAFLLGLGILGAIIGVFVVYIPFQVCLIAAFLSLVYRDLVSAENQRTSSEWLRRAVYPLAALAAIGGLAVFGLNATERQPSRGSPVISPGGDLVAFNYCETGDGCFIGIHVVASGESWLIEKPKRESWFRPVFSPDGEHIAFARRRGDWIADIAIIGRDGSPARALTEPASWTEPSSFSPDGRKLLFVRAGRTPATGGRTRNPTTRNDAYELDLDTGSERTLTDYDFYQMSHVAYFSYPDQIIFRGDGPRTPTSTSLDPEIRKRDRERYGRDSLYILNVAERPDYPEPMKLGNIVTSPSVSTDRSRIAYLRVSNDLDRLGGGSFNYDVFVRVDGVAQRLTHQRAHLRSAAISPDGSWVVYLKPRGSDNNPSRGMTELWRVDVETRIPTKLADVEPFLSVRPGARW
jgi:hypothetical protein